LPRPGPSGPCCVVTAPQDFLDDLLAKLAPFAAGSGHVGSQEVDTILGKLGRLAYLVPAARPFVSAMWGARAGCEAAASGARREAPPGRFAARRFAPAARWLKTLIAPPPSARTAPLLPLEHYVTTEVPVITLAGPSVQVDASPWGAGAVFCLGGVPKEFAHCSWSEKTAKRVGLTIGESSGQTFWEYLAILLVMEVWGTEWRSEGLAVLGDNLASLSGLTALRGKSQLYRVTCELAWRKVRYGWKFAAGHLPAESNVLADALSRLSAPAPNTKTFPDALRGARRRDFPDPEHLWVVS